MTNTHEQLSQSQSSEQIPLDKDQTPAEAVLRRSVEWGPTHHRDDYQQVEVISSDRPDDN